MRNKIDKSYAEVLEAHDLLKYWLVCERGNVFTEGMKIDLLMFGENPCEVKIVYVVDKNSIKIKKERIKYPGKQWFIVADKALKKWTILEPNRFKKANLVGDTYLIKDYSLNDLPTAEIMSGKW